MELQHEYLTEILRYEPETGFFYWNKQRPRIFVGKKAGYTKKPKNHVYIEIDAKSYMAHRLAWFYIHQKWPIGQIDHINRNPSDNRIFNLREATNGQNRANSKSSNKHGFKGVSHHPWIKKKPFQAQITSNKKVIYLGCYPTAEEAHSAYKKAAIELHQQFANP